MTHSSLSKPSNETLKCGLLGFGTVGQAVVELYHQNREKINQSFTQKIEITHIACRNSHKKRSVSLDPFVLVSAEELVKLDEIDIVIEVVGGVSPALGWIETALKNGKHVISANKALIAEHGAHLKKLACQNQVGFFYEASVAAGIPIMQILRESIKANTISEVVGIVNGTCNFILSAMSEDSKIDFESTLKRAQKLGYAEADPTFDIGGIDAMQKITILANEAFGCDFYANKVVKQGINGVSALDIELAKSMGYAIKHLAVAKKINHTLQLSALPMMIKLTHPLAQVSGVTNAVAVKSSALGQSWYVGPGAGGLATASAIWSDLNTIAHHYQPQYHPFKAFEQLKLLADDAMVWSHYLRLCVKDERGVLEKISHTLSDFGLSIDQVVQNHRPDHAQEATLSVITHKCETSNLKKAIAQLIKADFLLSPVTHYRVFS